jgi:hypothetical protein
MENKTHYRKVFKSDHLGSADLEEMIEEKKSLIFTIREVKQEFNTQVAGKKINANIAYFKEDIKPLVLNSTNSKQVAEFANSKFVEDWAGVTIELYIDTNVRMKGQTVSGVRIKSKPISWEPVEQLFKVKKESLTDEMQVNAQRIIDEKETVSYTKLYTYLKSL